MTTEIAGRKVYIEGSGGPLVILGIFKGEEYAGEVYREVKNILPDGVFTLAAFETADWDRDFSPWEAPGVMPGESFEGSGKETLSWVKSALENELRPYITDKIYIAGYSLAGLFALWSLYESDLFDGGACCSASLWFSGWDSFSKTHSLKKPGKVYLSLGGKEEKSSNPVLATIGTATKQQETLLNDDKNIINHKYELNPGGHFANSTKRLAKGIAWLIG